MVNYSTPDRSPWMPYPRVKTVVAVLWEGLKDGVRSTAFGLCVCYTSGRGYPGYWRLQVYQDLTYSLSCCGNVTLHISLDYFTNKQSRNQGEQKITSNPSLHVSY